MSTWSVDRAIRFLPIAVLVATFDRTVVAPMLIAMSSDFDVSLAAITVSVSAYLLAYGVAQPIWGLISDRLGRISTMRLALVLAALTDLLSIIPMSLELFIVIRGIAGATMAGVFPTAVVFIGDTVHDPRKRQPAIAGLQAGVAVGLTLGTVLGGVGVGLVGWQAFFALTAVVSLVIAAFLKHLPNPKPGEELLPIRKAFSVVFHNGWAWFLYALVFVEAAALLGGFSLTPAALENTGTSASIAGLMTGGYGISVLITSLVVRRVATRGRQDLLLLTGGVSAMVGFGLLAWHVSPLMVFISVCLQGVSWVTMHTTLQTWSTTLSNEARATAVSLFAGFMFLGSGFGALVAGYLLDFQGSTVMFLTVVVALAVLTVAAVIGSRRYDHRLG